MKFNEFSLINTCINPCMISKPKNFHVNYETDSSMTLTNNQFQIKLVSEHKVAKFLLLTLLDIVQEGF